MARFKIASVLAFWLAASTHAAAVTETLLACKRLQLKTDRRDPTLVRLRWKCPAKPLPLPAPNAEPTGINALLLLSHPSGTPALGAYIMPAAGWRRIGSPAAAKLFRYKGFVNGSPNTCRAVIATSGISVSCRLFVFPPLPVGYPLAVSLQTLGTSDKQRYCAEFGGFEQANDPQRLIRVNAPAPAACAPL